MPGTSARIFHFNDFEISVITPAVKRMKETNAPHVAVYELINSVEALMWGRIGAAIGYFPLHAIQAMEGILVKESEILANRVDKPSGRLDGLYESFWPARSTDTRELPSAPHLTHLFQSALLLETDAMNGEASALLSQIAFGTDDEWEALMLAQPEAAEVATAIGDNSDAEYVTCLYADYFAVLDHLTAFDDLFDYLGAEFFPNADEEWLRVLIGWTMRWRLNLWNPQTDQRFREITERAGDLLREEFKQIKADSEAGHAKFMERVEHLVGSWKMLTEGPSEGPLSGTPKTGPLIQPYMYNPNPLARRDREMYT